MDIVIVYYAVLLSVVNSFLLDDKLPQYATYGQSLVLVGGNLEENNTHIYRTIIKMAGGVNQAKIGIVVAASADPTDSCTYYTDMLQKRYHAGSVYCIPFDVNHTATNTNQNIVDKIKQQTGFFFGGGDQQRVIESLFLKDHVASPVLLAIRERYAAGAVVAGTSAGTACQPLELMIRGGMSWDALRYGAHQTESSLHPDDLVYNKDGGTGMINGFIVDTHFSQRGREGRLIRLLSDTRHSVHGADWGMGIDEDTALVVTHVGTTQEKGQVIGSNGVFLADVSQSQVDTSARYFSIRNVKGHFLTQGDSIFLQNKTVIFSSSKTPMAGNEKYDDALTTHDIFGGSRHHPSQKPEFTRVATSVFDSRLHVSSYGDTFEKNPRFRVKMSRGLNDAEGYVERKHSFHTDLTSYTNLYIEINETF